MHNIIINSTQLPTAMEMPFIDSEDIKLGKLGVHSHKSYHDMGVIRINPYLRSHEMILLYIKLIYPGVRKESNKKDL
jgi:hypothetical protein